MPVRTIARRLTAGELADYQAYHLIEPPAGYADDHRAALVAHTLHATMGGRAGYRAFVPRWEPAEPVPYRVWSEVFRAAAEAHNARVAKSKRG